MTDNTVMKRMFGPTTEQETGERRKVITSSIIFTHSHDIITITKLRGLARWTIYYA